MRYLPGHTNIPNEHVQQTGTTNDVKHPEDVKHPDKEQKWSDLPEEAPVPRQVPPIIEIKKVIPKHCFKSSLLRSTCYILKDLFIMIILYGTLRYLESQPNKLLTFLYTPVYCFLQGTMMWAFFVIGHDCGHGSFSRYTIANDIAGSFVHTVSLLPYYPWKMSHHHHHKNTNNLDEDEGYFPIRKRYSGGGGHPIYFLFGVGWWYFLHRGFKPRTKNHFNPFNPFFAVNFFRCVISLLLIGIWCSILYMYGCYYGPWALFIHYGIPAFVWGSWMVIVTFLHHTDEALPWYGDLKWDFVRGQLSTIDRHYGWFHSLTHNIGTHQIHHLFSKIPHYHLEEATTVYRKHFPKFTNISSEPIFTAYCRLFHVFQSQRVVDDDVQVHWYKKD